MRYFKKLASLPILVLPGVGRVYDGDLLMGDEFAQHVPMCLYETDAQGLPLNSAYPKPAPLPEPVHTVPPPNPASTHFSVPSRPPPPPELAKAWEDRKAVATNPAGANTLENALALAEQQTVPVSGDTEDESEEDDKVPEAGFAATMAPIPPRKRGRPRKNPLSPLPTPEEGNK